jgi:hypothetical protein
MTRSIIQFTFWSDKDLRTDSTILSLLTKIIEFGYPFIPNRYYLDDITRNREQNFKIPEHFKKVKEAINTYEVISMIFSRDDHILLHITRRGYDGVNLYGRPADPNVISLEIEANFLREEAFCQKFLDIGKLIHKLTQPHYGYGHDFQDSLSEEIYDQEKWLETDHRKELSMIHWANFLGPSLVESYGGKNKVLKAPCWMAEELPYGGVFLVLSPSPLHPESKESREKQNEVLNYFGLPLRGEKRLKKEKIGKSKGRILGGGKIKVEGEELKYSIFAEKRKKIKEI